MNSSGDITRWVVPSRRRGLQLQHDLASGVGLYAFIGQRRACDVAAQLLQRLVIVGAAAHGSVQAETVDVGAQMPIEVGIPGHDALHRQHLLAGTRPEGDPISTGRCLQRPERAGFLRVAVVVGHVSRTLLFDQNPPIGSDSTHWRTGT
jgi:hypothetical protein